MYNDILFNLTIWSLKGVLHCLWLSGTTPFFAFVSIIYVMDCRLLFRCLYIRDALMDKVFLNPCLITASSFTNVTGIIACAYKFINNKGFKCTWNRIFC